MGQEGWGGKGKLNLEEVMNGKSQQGFACLVLPGVCSHPKTQSSSRLYP